MRPRVLAALLFAASAAGAGACAPRAQPYRFSMPMLGHADVPAETLSGSVPGSGGQDGSDSRPDKRRDPRRGRSSAPRPSYAYGWQRDAQSGIRTVSAYGIELKQPEASSEAAAAVTQAGVAHVITAEGLAAARLPAPHKASTGGATAAIGATSGTSATSAASAASATSAIELPRMRAIREPSGLRALVGTRDKRDAFAITMGWLAELGITFVEPGSTLDMATSLANKPGDGPALVAWAAARGKRLAPTDAPSPGDALVFDRATSDGSADLIGIVIARDERGITEFVYPGGGVIRHGFVDASQPRTRRDLGGGVVNTFLRHTKKWPPKGTRYLAGELLAHVIRTR